ncbi:phage scaffolding protein [Paenibacillus melissococcoides]|uniref:Phage scaffolding protein n=1 Tax=Paenibacillus melissococcoides TaxID=2912268 RepID=A0ABM9GB91_9BACL|nr:MULTISPECIES: phage scaffolding protein [Paenibacillus]CAH8246861.1 phage scaffolding protein [Paenibacillus melissococcoides]CAH8249017.1 phage scaffolding protein [Paenibacillus melissococcoides]CAH8710724.1 phage scaffolding protein [Paenibacillus melissococcoides]CAH8715978.1 phage scaffolding protein [Paenibacillus melissococcoides]CAH8716932.1 phage scaffolding protein [Paenibacillus melissococcoides]
MDWLKVLLQKLGIADTEIEKIDAEVRKELPMHFVPKDKYNEAAEAKKKAEKDVADRDKQIEDLGKAAGLSEELKKQIEQLQVENKTAKEKYESDLKELTLTNAIKSALSGKVHDEALVTGLFDKSKLVIDGDKVVGLEEQLKDLQEHKGFLFKTEETQQQQQQPGFKVGGNGEGTPPNNKPVSLAEAIASHFKQ